MKSLRDYSMNLTEQDYHDYPAWSYSMIARYAREGFSAVAKIHDKVKPNDAMRFGSLFDCLLTRGKKAKEEYTTLDKPVPDAERNVLDVLLTLTKDPFIAIPDNIMKQAIEICSYQSRWKYETQLEHIKAYEEYYEKKRLGLEIVTQQDWEDAVDMVRIVINFEYLKEHFKHKDEDGKEYIYQAQFKTTFDFPDGPVEVKIMPDMLEVDHNNKTIQPWDVKTSSNPGYDLPEQFVRMRYDIQAVLYSDVLHKIMNEIEDYKDYTILPYNFMDISRTDKVPVTWTYDQTDPSQFDGFCFGADNIYKYKSWKELLSEILKYEKENAVVPSNITLAGPNNLLEFLNAKR